MFGFIVECDNNETWAQVSVGVLTIGKDVQLSPNQLHLDSASTSIIVEWCIVMDDLMNLPEALCLFHMLYIWTTQKPLKIRSALFKE